MARKMKRPFLPEEQVCHATNIRVAVRGGRESVKNLNFFYFIFSSQTPERNTMRMCQAAKKLLTNKSLPVRTFALARILLFLRKYLVYSDKKGVLFRAKYSTFFFFIDMILLISFDKMSRGYDRLIITSNE